MCDCCRLSMCDCCRLGTTCGCHRLGEGGGCHHLDVAFICVKTIQMSKYIRSATIYQINGCQYAAELKS